MDGSGHPQPRIMKIAWNFNIDIAGLSGGITTPGDLGIHQLKVWVWCNDLCGTPQIDGPDGRLMPLTDVSGIINIENERWCDCASFSPAIDIKQYHSIAVSMQTATGHPPSFPATLANYKPLDPGSNILIPQNNFHISVGLAIKIDSGLFLP